MSKGSKDFLDNGSGLRRTLKQRSITLSFEAREYLAAVETDGSLLAIARNLFTRNLGLTAGSGAVLVVEVGYEEIGAPILRAAGKEGIDLTVFMVGADQASNDSFVERLTTRMSDVDASLFVGSYDGLPGAFRRALIATAKGHRRHAHLAGITKSVMLQAVRGDHNEAHRFGETLNRALGDAQRIDVNSAMGTKLHIKLGPMGWHHASSLIPTGKWSYLPGGQVLTTPVSVDGVLVPDGGVFMPDATEHPRSPRLAIHFDKGQVTRIEGIEESDPLMELLGRSTDCKRVGRLAFGTNTGLIVSVGALLQDRTAPGFHLTLGHPSGELTGAKWSCPVEVPLFVRRADVLADGTPILVRGRYARNLREAQTG